MEAVLLTIAVMAVMVAASFIIAVNVSKRTGNNPVYTFLNALITQGLLLYFVCTAYTVWG